MSAVTTAPPSEPPRKDTAPYRLRWFVLAVVLGANIMDLIDATIVNIAGPTIRHDLGGSATTLQWLSASYTLAFAVLLITGAPGSVTCSAAGGCSSSARPASP